MGITADFSHFISGHDRAALPAEVRHQAVRCLVNLAGCTLGGARHEAAQTAWTALRPFMGPPQATLLGRAERTDALHAALINGIASHVLDFDDTHLATLVHPSGPVVAALLALAQHLPISGADLVDAVAVGIEVECRIALGICPAHYDRGWHVTGTVGGLGAAAAAARAMRLDPQRTAWALGTAATQACGLREMFGTMCKSLHPGRAAQAGLMAALAAAAGFTSSLRAIEAPRGFAEVLGEQPDYPAMLAGLGQDWVVMENSFKPYACGLVIHPVIDACLALRAEAVDDPAAIAAVTLDVHPLVLELTGKAEPADGLEGKFSVHHSAAATLNDGYGSARQYSDEAVDDPRNVALRRKVTLRPDPAMRKDEARVTVTLAGGGQASRHVEHALGSLQRPMGDADLDAKFLDLAADVLAPGHARRALQACWDAPGLARAADVAEALAAPSQQAR